MTIETAYNEALQQLQPVYQSRPEAAATVRIMLGHIVGDAYIHLKAPQKVLLPEQIQQYENYLSQLITGQPLPYVIGEREFYGRTFISDKRALIPRPETELLVENAVRQFKDFEKVLLADLGCGSGCIGVSIACELPQARVILTDISAEALDLAHENAIKHDVANRVLFSQGAAGDWATPVQKVLLEGEKLDGIVTNPPYVRSGVRLSLQPSVRKYEPDVALFGGDDGLENHRYLSTQCVSILKNDGILWSEVGDGQYDAARAVYEDAGWHAMPAIEDLAGIERVLCVRRNK